MSRRAPWTLIGHKNTYDVYSAEELLRRSNLDWTVSLQELQTTTGLNIKDRFATVKTTKSGDSTVLSVVGSRYQVIQNSEVFNCLDDIVSIGEASYTAAGELGNGKIVWTTLALPDNVSVKDDPHAAYIVARTSHDGSTPFQITPIVTRLNCTNQINLTMFNASKTNSYYSIRHTANGVINPDDIRKALGIVRNNIDIYADMSNVLQSIKFDDDQFKNFVKSVYPLPTKIELLDGDMLSASEKRVKTATLRNRRHAMLVWSNETGTQENISGTKFGAFQAIVEVADHFAKSDTKQAEKTILGKDIDIKNRALQLLGA